MDLTRLALDAELREILESSNCYFTPPSTMQYPCIRYVRETPLVMDADNLSYHERDRWTVTVIDYNPDSEIPGRLKAHFKRYCRKDREYTTDGLYHFVFNLYY